MIIGLYGDSRSGKDTISRILVEQYQFEWRSFAAPLREILYQINPIIGPDGMTYQSSIRNYGLDWTKKHYPLSVEYMIRLGQAARDLLDENVWVSPVFTDPLPKNMVISDVRQPNEYEAITAAGGEIWKVVRPGTTRRGMDGLLDDCHFPVTVCNDSNYDDLTNLVKAEVNHALQHRWV